MKEKGVVCWHTSTAASNLMVLRTTEGSPASSATSAGFPSHLSLFDKANEASIFAVGSLVPSNSQVSHGGRLGFCFLIQAAWGLNGGIYRRLRAKRSRACQPIKGRHRTHSGCGQGSNARVQAPM